MVDQVFVDLGLRPDAPPAMAAEADQNGFGPAVFEEPGIDQVVVEDDVGRREAARPAQGDQSGIARSRSDQIDFAGSGRSGGTGDG